MKKFFLFFTIIIHGISLSVPFIYIDGYNQLDIRILGVPIVYLLSSIFLTPITILIFLKFSLIKKNMVNLYFFLILISSILSYNIIESISFWFVLLFEIYVVYLLVKYLKRIEIKTLNMIGKYFFITHIIVSLVGLFRYLTGIAYDTSPFPEMNRNLALLIYFNSLIIIDLLSYKGVISKEKKNFIFLLSLIIVAVAGQRSFIVALSLITLSKFFMKDFGVRTLLMSGIAIVIAFLSGLLDYSIERFSGLALYADSNIDFDKIENDKDRIFMVLDSFEIWGNNKIFGIGFGTDNYAFQHGKFWINTPRASLPHNLFVSLLTQNGILGYTVFILYSIYICWKMLSQSSLGKIRVGAIILAYLSIYFSNQYIFYPLLFYMYAIIYYLIMNINYDLPMRE